MKIQVLRDSKLVQAEIAPINKREIPLIKDGWTFNWRKIATEADANEQIYALKIEETGTVEGVLHLIYRDGMYEMEHLEIAPHNIGSSQKKYQDVAGCLIAFGCYRSLSLNNEFRGVLAFIPKAELEDWYIQKYGAEPGIHGRMIFLNATPDLISKYIYRD